MLPRVVVSYLTGDFPWAQELMAFWISFQGAKEVCIPVVHDADTNPNANTNGTTGTGTTTKSKKKTHWCHALLLTLVTGQGGAAFAPLWMGKSVSMLQHDFHVACCIFCFVLFTYILPANNNDASSASASASARWLHKSIWVKIVTVAFSQLFRAMAICQYTSQANSTLVHHATSNKFYPIPIFAPIAHGALLGNLGGFFSKSFHNHMDQQGKIPWSFQNGLVCSAFYHFLVHDQTGPIGRCLRHCIYHYLAPLWQGNDELFAMVTISLFMQIVGFLQMPQLLGPNFNPFLAIMRLSTRRIRATLVVQMDDDRTESSSYCTSPIPPCQSQEQGIVMEHSKVIIGPDISPILVSDTLISHDDSLDSVTTRRSMKWKHPRWKRRKIKAT